MGRDLWPIRSPDGTRDERESGKSREESADALRYRQKRMHVAGADGNKNGRAFYTYFF